MNVFGAISEAFHDLIECFSAICGEEVSPMHRREIIKSDEGVETSFALGAFERVVCEVCEVALNGSFVGEYHI